MTSAGTSFVTTDPAPITERAPIVTPGHTTTLPPSHTPSSIVMGETRSHPCGRSSGSSTCVGVYRRTLGPIRTSAPMRISPPPSVRKSALTNVRSPTCRRWP
ncbi:hypothetical protein CWIS_14525 [Cellulomonas sp. A375-1]|nr:hypothetical protein CWIS_14525 [Cellulomonas sp. A375-1]